MATVAETQAYLNEAKTPSVIAPADVRAAVKAFVDTGAKAKQQGAILCRLLQAAEITEPDAGLRGLMEEGFQKLGALQREAQEAEQALREIIQVQREFAEWHQRFRAAAQALGYVV